MIIVTENLFIDLLMQELPENQKIELQDKIFHEKNEILTDNYFSGIISIIANWRSSNSVDSLLFDWLLSDILFRQINVICLEKLQKMNLTYLLAYSKTRAFQEPYQKVIEDLEKLYVEQTSYICQGLILETKIYIYVRKNQFKLAFKDIEEFNNKWINDASVLSEIITLSINIRKAWALSRIGSIDEALSLAQSKKAEAFKVGHLALVAEANRIIGSILYTKGQILEGQQIIEETLPLAKEISDIPGELALILSYGNILFGKGEYAHSKDLFERSLELAIRLGDIGIQSELTINLARIFLELGDTDRSLQHAQQCIDIFGNQISLEFALQLAYIYSRLEKFDNAEKYLQLSQQMSINSPGTFNQANLEYVKGEFYLAKKFWNEANLTLNEALGLADAGKFHELSLTVILRLAEVNIHLAVDQDEKIAEICIRRALRFLEDGTILAEEYGITPVLVNLYLIRSLLEINRGRWNDSEKYLNEAENIARASNLSAIYADRFIEQQNALVQAKKETKKKSGFLTDAIGMLRKTLKTASISIMKSKHSEPPLAIYVFLEGGLPVYSLKLTNIIQQDDLLFAGFLEAISSFAKNSFGDKYEKNLIKSLKQ